MKINCKIEIASNTDVGTKRTNNEDYTQVEQSLGLVVLADGMGGYLGGEIASKLATTTIINEIKKNIHSKLSEPYQTSFISSDVYEIIHKAVKVANKIVYEMAINLKEYTGMGTTIVFAMFFNDRVLVGHIGDSKLFRYRYGELIPLTNDHSLIQEQINLGYLTYHQAKEVKYKNLVTRALGVEADVKLELQEFEILENDLYLLCSDGLSDYVTVPELEVTIKNNEENIYSISKSLIEQANYVSGKDNVSVIMVNVV